jgi:hypothetical protein
MTSLTSLSLLAALMALEMNLASFLAGITTDTLEIAIP